MSEHFTVTLPDGAHFSAKADENLLRAAQRAHWLVRYGCRNGNCLACSARLLEGSVVQRDTSIQRSSDDSSAAPEILLCLCTAHSDLRIELPGNPQHGSAEQARRSYARLDRIDTAADQTTLHFLLPAGRQPPLYPGQYALIETAAGTRRAEIATGLSRARALVLLTAATAELNAGSYFHLRYPLGYRYVESATASTLILTDGEPSLPARLLRQSLPGATALAIDAIGRVAAMRFDCVLACAADEREAERWYDALLQAEVAFDELRSDDRIRYRWRVLRQDDNGNRFVVAEGLSEETARSRASAFEQRGHKQLYWVEPMSR